MTLAPEQFDLLAGFLTALLLFSVATFVAQMRRPDRSG